MDFKLPLESQNFTKRVQIALRIGSQKWGPMSDFLMPTREALVYAVILRAEKVKDTSLMNPKYWSVAHCVRYLLTNRTDNEPVSATTRSATLWKQARCDEEDPKVDVPPPEELKNAIQAITRTISQQAHQTTPNSSKKRKIREEFVQINEKKRKQDTFLPCPLQPSSSPAPTSPSQHQHKTLKPIPSNIMERFQLLLDKRAKQQHSLKRITGQRLRTILKLMVMERTLKRYLYLRERGIIV